MNRHLLLSLGFLSLLFFVSCQKEESFEIGQLAKGILQDSTGDCYPKAVVGTYATGQALGATSYIEVTVNVTQTGAYNIFTDTVNGYSFKGVGNFNSTGTNTVQLQASGTPGTVGVDNFIVFFDNSICAIAVTVTQGSNPSTPSDDYFPLTQNTWWSYDDGAGSDSIKTVVNGSSSLGGNNYQRLISSDDFGPYDTSFYRKDGSGTYYIYQKTDDLTAFGLTFTQPGLDVAFLKNTLTTGEVFNSDHPTTLAGFPSTLRFKNSVIAANTTLTVNGKNFTNVHHIQIQLQIGSIAGFNDLPLAPFDVYFAKGIGLIKSVDPFEEEHIRHWQVF